jgi:hypothetical protein
LPISFHKVQFGEIRVVFVESGYGFGGSLGRMGSPNHLGVQLGQVDAKANFPIGLGRDDHRVTPFGGFVPNRSDDPTILHILKLLEGEITYAVGDLACCMDGERFIIVFQADPHGFSHYRTYHRA